MVAAIRIGVIALIVVNMLLLLCLPRARPGSGLAVIGIELLLLGRLMTTVADWGAPLRWYGAPLTYLAMTFLLAFLLRTFQGHT